MLNTQHRTLAQARRSAYLNPLVVLDYLLDTNQPIPVDLQDDLVSLGVDVAQIMSTRDDQETNLGYQLV